MKLLFILAAYFGLCSFSYGQMNTFPGTGKVGIGTLTPRSSLEVQDSVSSLNISTNKPTEIMVNNEVIGSINFYKHYAIAYSGAIKLLQAGGSHQYAQAHLAFYTSNDGNPYTSNPIERLRITSIGDVGIGTADTKGYKLAVAGSMIAESIKVKLQSLWPDFVFAKSYTLPTLKETENHIKEKGHLPGIPSAAEVKEQGLDLGVMNAKLLQKIEELTLHLIEKEKQIEKQNNLLKAVEDKNQDYESRLNSIERLLKDLKVRL